MYFDIQIFKNVMSFLYQVDMPIVGQQIYVYSNETIFQTDKY